ncbi:MAG TPA: LON peptidase substrate-binding domain-containing protein [Longimicrobiales bacterium]|nr:LON peptidase substrate-binding domain-containing protein [Longimicrobiales bacterium]
MVTQTRYTRSTTRDWMVVVAALLALPAGGVAQGAPAGSEPLPATVPIFPLPDVTLLPNSTQPFHIFEPRYRAMVADALAGDSIIGMVVLQPGREADYQGRRPVYAIGCAGVVVAAELLPDGRYDIVLRGLTRFTILQEDASRPYRLAEVEELVEAPVTDRDLLASRRQQLEAAVRTAFPRAPTLRADLSHEEVIDGLSIALPMAPAQRLELLQADGPLERAAILVRVIRGGAQA